GRACLNARLTPRELESACALDREGRTLLKAAVGNLTLTARGIVKVKRVARTLADLGHRDAVTAEDVSEALLLRRLEEAESMSPARASPARASPSPSTRLAAPA